MPPRAKPEPSFMAPSFVFDTMDFAQWKEMQQDQRYRMAEERELQRRRKEFELRADFWRPQFVPSPRRICPQCGDPRCPWWENQ